MIDILHDNHMTICLNICLTEEYTMPLKSSSPRLMYLLSAILCQLQIVLEQTETVKSLVVQTPCLHLVNDCVSSFQYKISIISQSN